MVKREKDSSILKQIVEAVFWLNAKVTETIEVMPVNWPDPLDKDEPTGTVTVYRKYIIEPHGYVGTERVNPTMAIIDALREAGFDPMLASDEGTSRVFVQIWHHMGANYKVLNNEQIELGLDEFWPNWKHMWDDFEQKEKGG